jgi:hypothetical protein
MRGPDMRAWICLVIELCELCAFGGIAACGGGGGSHPVDAAPALDAPTPDAPAPDAGPPPCGYTEKADATNDPTGDTTAGPAAEPTGLTVGIKPQTLCGTINTGHFNAATNAVDSDAYRVTTEGTGSLVVRFSGSPGTAAMVDFSVFVFNTDEIPTLLFGANNSALVRDHGAFLITLPAGMYDFVVTAHNSADLAAPFDYKVQLAPDGPTRCPAATAPAAYAEAADGTGMDNDVIALDFLMDPPFQLTANAADAPEPTGLTINASTPVRITGSSADEDTEGDYMDRDTYLVRTAATTTELTLRLAWANAQASFDYFVFPADQTDRIGDSFRVDSSEKYNVVAVKPDSAYWIWIGSHDGSTGLPAAYDLTICGATSIP